eukprot:2983005-Prymnesium_polylepis.1
MWGRDLSFLFIELVLSTTPAPVQAGVTAVMVLIFVALQHKVRRRCESNGRPRAAANVVPLTAATIQWRLLSDPPHCCAPWQFQPNEFPSQNQLETRGLLLAVLLMICSIGYYSIAAAAGAGEASTSAMAADMCMLVVFGGAWAVLGVLYMRTSRAEASDGERARASAPDSPLPPAAPLPNVRPPASPSKNDASALKASELERLDLSA